MKLAFKGDAFICCIVINSHKYEFQQSDCRIPASVKVSVDDAWPRWTNDIQEYRRLFDRLKNVIIEELRARHEIGV